MSPRGFYHVGYDATFLRQLDKLRARDEESIGAPLYQQQLELLFSSMADAFNVRMVRVFGSTDFSSLPDLISVIGCYSSGEASGDVRADYIISRVGLVCEMLHVVEGYMGVNVLASQYCLAIGKPEQARAFFAPLLIPAVEVYRKRAGSLARKGGSGRRYGPYFDEGVELGWGFHAENPEATRHKIARLVEEEIDRRHGHSPTVRTIENWLDVSGLRFNKKCVKSLK